MQICDSFSLLNKEDFLLVNAKHIFFFDKYPGQLSFMLKSRVVLFLTSLSEDVLHHNTLTDSIMICYMFWFGGILGSASRPNISSP